MMVASLGAVSPTDHGQRRWNLEWIPLVGLAMYFTRDSMGGFFRYFTQIFHISPVWFVPDILAFACIPYFIYKAVWMDRNGLAAITCIGLLLYVILGGIFLGSANALLSSIKMMVPIFVGFCFYNKSIGDYRRLILLLEFLLYLSIGGVIASAHIRMPWTNFSFESFGTVRTAGRLWWAGSEERLAGFAADNTMAALFILLTFVIASFRKSTSWCLIVGAFGLYACRITTSKTSLGTLALYLICLLVCRALPVVRRFGFVRRLGLVSFVAMFIPLLSIVLLSGIDLTDISQDLFSLQDRINNSWQKPFIYMTELFPAGLAMGCGVGCFNYPQAEFSEYAIYWVPEDNFYLGTYTMLGLPFVLFMAKVFDAMRSEQDIYKLVLVFVMNVFTVTVLSYGPATGLIVMALCFSTVFRSDLKRGAVGAAMARLRETPVRPPPQAVPAEAALRL